MKLRSILDKNKCPDREGHTLAPVAYAEWHIWAGRMAKTHRQKPCPTCGLFTIWVPRRKAVRSMKAKGSE